MQRQIHLATDRPPTHLPALPKHRRVRGFRPSCCCCGSSNRLLCKLSVAPGAACSWPQHAMLLRQGGVLPACSPRLTSVTLAGASLQV